MVTETHTVAVSSESAVNIGHPRQDAIASYVGVGVLLYVLLLYALAPGNSQPKRPRSFL